MQHLYFAVYWPRGASSFRSVQWVRGNETQSAGGDVSTEPPFTKIYASVRCIIISNITESKPFQTDLYLMPTWLILLLSLTILMQMKLIFDTIITPVIIMKKVKDMTKEESQGSAASLRWSRNRNTSNIHYCKKMCLCICAGPRADTIWSILGRDMSNRSTAGASFTLWKVQMGPQEPTCSQAGRHTLTLTHTH